MASESYASDAALLSDQNNSQNVIVDNGLLVIEELRPPDKPQGREVREYVDKTTRSIHPTTGDQVVFRLREADSGSYINSGAADLASADSAGTPQVAILGSPKVPVGLSSALGYLQLGHLARIKVPADFMQQAVTDTDAALKDIPPQSYQQQPVTHKSPRTVVTPHTTPTAATTTTAVAVVVPKELDSYRLAPAPAAAYHREMMSATQQASPSAAAAAAANGGHLVHGSTGSSEVVTTSVTSSPRNNASAVAPPLLPAAVPEQQSLRERFQQQQQQQQQQQSPGKVATLAAKYQQQSDQIVQQQHSPGKVISPLEQQQQQQAVHMFPGLQAALVSDKSPTSNHEHLRDRDVVINDVHDQSLRDQTKPAAAAAAPAPAAAAAAAPAAAAANESASSPIFPDEPLQRQDSDHSSWIQDSVRSSLNDAAAARYQAALAAAGGGAVPASAMMTNRPASASGWTSGTNTPMNGSLRGSLERIGEDGWPPQPPAAAVPAVAAAPAAAPVASSSSVYQTPGGTHYHSAASTPVPCFSNSSGSSSAGDLRLSSPGGNNKSPFHYDKVTYDNKVTSDDDNAFTSPEECASPELSSSPVLRNQKQKLPAAAAIAKDVTGTLNAAVKQQQDAAGLPAAAATTTAAAAADRAPARDRAAAAAALMNTAPPVAKSARTRQVGPLQTPDEVLQAAAKKLEQQQQQGSVNFSVESLGSAWNPQTAASSSITSMVSMRRSRDVRTPGGVSDTKRSIEWGTKQGLLPPPGPAAAAAGSSAAGHPSVSQVGREGSASFKSWLPVRISSDRVRDSATISAADQSGSTNAAAVAAAVAAAAAVAKVEQQQQQPDMRVSIDKRMRYSGDYGSLRGSRDLDQQLDNGIITIVDDDDHPAAAADATAAAAAKGPVNNNSSNDVASNPNDAGAAAAAANKKEYILELLAIVPGRGKMSGKPVLSTVAQQQPDLDIDRLTRTLVPPSDKPLLPPKPQTGLRGWVRRHLSLNVRAPASAGKTGAKWLGLGNCFKGSQ